MDEKQLSPGKHPSRVYRCTRYPVFGTPGDISKTEHHYFHVLDTPNNVVLRRCKIYVHLHN